MSFARHFAEMLAAMVLGMAVVHPLGAGALVMALAMSLPMAVLMRHRGRGWGEVAEMTAAMLLLAPLGLHVMHAAMVPVMLVVMLAQERRRSPRSSRSIRPGCSRTSA